MCSVPWRGGYVIASARQGARRPHNVRRHVGEMAEIAAAGNSLPGPVMRQLDHRIFSLGRLAFSGHAAENVSPSAGVRQEKTQREAGFLIVDTRTCLHARKPLAIEFSVSVISATRTICVEVFRMLMRGPPLRSAQDLFQVGCKSGRCIGAISPREQSGVMEPA